jgi:hypothetical protein
MKRFLTALAVVCTTIFAAAACNDYGNTFQSNTGAIISTLSPSNIVAGSTSFTLTVSGQGFVTQTYIAWNGTRLATTDIDDSSGDVLAVSAVVPASLVATAGSATIITHNPFSGAGNNGLSNPLNFIITSVIAPNPTPLLASLSPTNVTVGSVPAQGVTLTLTGGKFVTNSDPTQAATVCWAFGSTTPPTPPPAASAICGTGATPLSLAAGTAASTTQIVVNVPQSFFSAAGAASVFVVNPPNSAGTPPAGGGGQSNPLAFNVLAPNPVPTLISINPATTAAGSAPFTLTVTGNNFVTNSDPTQAANVFWSSGGTSTMLSVLSMPAAPSATQISVAVPANLVAAAGTATVYVVNPPNRFATPPGGGGGTSGSQPFTITAATQAGVAPGQSAAEETPAVSADARYVAYTGMQGQYAAIFFRDTCEGAAAACQPQTSLVSVSADGAAANGDSHTPSMSADGRYVAFASAATNLVAAATASANAASSSAPSGEPSALPGPGRQIYLRDTCVGAPSGCMPSTQLVSTDPSGQLVGTESILPSVSASGRFVAFVAVTPSKSPSAGAAQTTASQNSVTQSGAANNSGFRQVFVRDTCLGASSCTAKTTRVSLQPGDGVDNAPAVANPAGPALSGDAKKIALTGGGTAVLFMHSVAVDDRLFVSALGQSQ